MINRHTLSPLIVGKGIEIGAYHNPWPLTDKASITYIDRQPYEKLIEMRNNDPCLGPSKPISRVDIVDDGQFLEKIADESQDFVLSSHQLEHCFSPLAAIQNHVRVLKQGGKIFYAIPDMRFTFDRDRRKTSFGDLNIINAIQDTSRLKGIMIDLFQIYYRDVDKIDPSKLLEKAEQAYADKLDIHFHCWTAISLLEMFIELAPFYGFDIELFSRAGHENFVVLRKE